MRYLSAINKMGASALLLCASLASASAQNIPEGYYKSADQLSGSDLKTALFNVIKNHTVISYSGLWNAYETTDVVPGTNDQVYDLFSPDVNYYSNRGNINREHVVPQSWWGGGSKYNCYSDLWNVYPSEIKANSAKSNYPLGKIKAGGKVTYDNGIMRVGTGEQSGGSSYVFEPCDEYKGDFARTYMYVATCYQNVSWTSGAYAMTAGANAYPTLQNWIIDLLLEWNAQDPVSEKEKNRQEAVYGIQHNRNPFVDYPQLADYIWGSKKNQPFDLATAVVNGGSDAGGGTGGTDYVPKCEVPVFTPAGGRTAQQAVYVTEGTLVTVSTANPGATLYYRFNEAEQWDSIPASTPQDMPELEFAVDASCCVEAYTSCQGYRNSASVVAYYAVLVDTGEFLLLEDFNDVTEGNSTSSSGSSAAWSENDNFVKATTVYKAGGAVRMGSSKNTGKLVSRVLAFAGGTVIVELDVKGWTTVEGELVITLTGASTQNLSYTAKMEDDFETVTATFTGVSANPTLTIETSSKRCFIDAVRVKSGNADTHLDAVNQNPNGAPAQIADLYGRRFKELPSQPGIYVVNGKKTWVR